MINIKTRLTKFTKVKEIEVSNNLGLKLVLVNIGAGIKQVYLFDKPMTYSDEDLSSYIYDGGYLGKIVGRTSGRIKDGIAIINNKEYKLLKFSKHHLHGGKGFSFRPFEVEIKEDEENINVEFFYFSKDLECGYPGNLEVKITYIISKLENKFAIDYKAISDQDTLCNLTNHVYWNLNGYLDNIGNHKLKVDASKYVEVDNELIFKSIKDVDNVFDFRKGKLIKDDLYSQNLLDNAGGYDHDLILDSDEVVLENETISLIMKTTLPICHIYTGNYLKDKYYGVALEFEKEAYDLDKVFLKKDELYHQVTLYSFIKK